MLTTFLSNLVLIRILVYLKDTNTVFIMLNDFFLKDGMSLHVNKFESPYRRMFCANFLWNQQIDGQTNARQNMMRESHFSFQLKWAKNAVLCFLQLEALIAKKKCYKQCYEKQRILSGFLLINETFHISVYKLSLSYVYMIALSARNEINSHILHLISTIIWYCYFIKI